MGQEYCSFTPCTEASSDTTCERYKNRNRNFNMEVKQQHVSERDDNNTIELPYEDLYLFDNHSNSFKLNISDILQERVQTPSNLIQSTTQKWDISDIESMENDMEHQMNALTIPSHNRSLCSNLYSESSINWKDDKIDNTLHEMKKEVQYLLKNVISTYTFQL
eukprot:496830_1